MRVKLYDNNDPVEVEFLEKAHRYKVNGNFKPGVTGITGILWKDLLGWAAYEAAKSFQEAVKPFATTSESMTAAELKKLSDSSKKAHTRKSDRGKDVGTIAHEWIDEETKLGKTVDVPTYVVDMLTPVQAAIDELERQENPDKEKLAELKEEMDTVKHHTNTAVNCVNSWRRWKADYDVEIVKAEFLVYSKNLDYCGTCDVLFYSHRLNKYFLGDYKTSDPKRVRNHRYQVVRREAYPEHFVQISGYDYAHNEEYPEQQIDGYMAIYLPKEGQYQTFTREKVEHDREGWEKLVGTYRWFKEIERSKS